MPVLRDFLGFLPALALAAQLPCMRRSRSEITSARTVMGSIAAAAELLLHVGCREMWNLDSGLADAVDFFFQLFTVIWGN